MRSALQESLRVLKRGGHLVLVVGNSQMAGREFATADYLSSVLEKSAWNRPWCCVTLSDHADS